MGLELYAKIEPLLGFEEHTKALYTLYLDEIRQLNPKSILDIGCGNGAFMQLASQYNIEGIDLSHNMVKIAQSKGLKAKAMDVCDVDKKYEVAVAIFDVLNYLNGAQLTRFLDCVYELLDEGGYFIADINTLHGFEEVAEGTLMREDENHTLIVDAYFEQHKLQTTFTLFEKEGEYYRKSQDSITQYFHRLKDIKSKLKLESKFNVALFSERPDKTVLIFKK